MTMTHPGLPLAWGGGVCVFMALALVWFFVKPNKIGGRTTRHFDIMSLPFLGSFLHYLTTHNWILLVLKGLFAALFLLIIWAGLFGTPIAERNIATVFTWNLWWSGLIIAVFFIGSAWCAVCPWNSIARWLVHPRILNFKVSNSLGLKVPKSLRTLWPALWLFVGLTWLELGFGITTDPYATALIALVMIILTTTTMALFERQAFCHYFCPVGRTIGFYSQLAPVELRPQSRDVCLDCTTLECYYGSDEIPPCPTHQVMGRMTQNTYCLSCGNCSQSCPYENVTWRLRPPSAEAVQDARPHWDEAWFMVILLALTGFHGITMMPFWESWMSELARTIGDKGQLLVSFSIGMSLSISLVALLYLVVVWLTKALSHTNISFKALFSQFAFVSLPLAFAYHLAHNLNHLTRESFDFGALLANPLGVDTLPLTMAEKHDRMMDMALAPSVLFAIQAGLLAFGFFISLLVIKSRSANLIVSHETNQLYLLPMLLFAIVITGAHLWLLMQPMVMRL